MEKPRLLFVYNPNAGKAKIGTGLSSFIDIFSNAGYEVIAYPTKKHLDARDVVEDYLNRQACDRIICAGGDGTLNEVVNGSMICENKVPIGYIPAGTTNDFAYSLGIPTEKKKAAKTAAEGKVFCCDVGKFEEQYFTYTAAFGLFTDVSYETPQNVKNALGRLAYILSGISKLSQIKPYYLKAEYENGEIEGEFLYGMIANTNSVGGFKNLLTKDVVLDDGFYEMLFIYMPQKLGDLQAIITDLKKGDLNNQNVFSARVSAVTFHSKVAIPWTLDGEFGGEHRDGKITIIPRAVPYIIPK